jgi:hypothetical protein
VADFAEQLLKRRRRFFVGLASLDAFTLHPAVGVTVTDTSYRLGAGESLLGGA